jgi:hypothetical protein
MSILETLEGRGRISRGSDVLLVDVPYSITYYQREIDDRRGGSIPGMRRMKARIDVDPLKAATLMIEQGHCLSLVVGQFENLGHSARASDVR